MVSYLFDQYILIYSFAGLCGLGIVVRFLVNMLYKRLVRETDNPGETKNKMLKVLKMKFEKLYKLKIGVNNVDTFVDKNVLRYRFCGVLLSTWENFCGQVLFLILLMVPVCTVFGVAFGCEQDRVLLTGSVGILAGSVLILVDKSINLNGKRKMIRINLLDYFENIYKVRLEQEELHPELIDQYRREYFQAMEAGKQISAASQVLKEEPREELNRRREAREKKEEERKQQLLRREEEQKRLEQSRKEEEKRRFEERRLTAQKRREEELQRLEEERKTLEAKREELRRRAEQRQHSSERKRFDKEEKDKLLHSMEQDVKPNTQKSSMGEIIDDVDKLTQDRERELYGRPLKEKENTEKARTADTKTKATEVNSMEGMYLGKDKPLEDLQSKQGLNVDKQELDQEVAATAESVMASEPVAAQPRVKEEDKEDDLLYSMNRNRNKELQQGIAFNKLKLQGITPQEEKVIEDILKEFFA